MAELITGDTSKGIKTTGELALRISRFDSYRLFTLYENVKERKLMDVSGNNKYYLVFRSPKKEIRIPEYEPNGFFEVDKVNGCILFKITKKNAEDILSMRTGGEKIFHIIRVFEQVDDYGRVLSVTDEVEVFNGKWGDDADFSAYSLENKIDLLTKALAAQIDKNANLMKEYNDLLETYNAEVKKNTELEKEVEALRSERDALQEALNEYLGDTHEGTLLSTDTKYVAFESTLDNISFTEEQYSKALNELMTKGEVNLSNDIDVDDPKINLNLKVYSADANNLKITVYKNDVSVGSAMFEQTFYKTMDVGSGDVFKFVCSGIPPQYSKELNLEYTPTDPRYSDIVNIKKINLTLNSPTSGTTNGLPGGTSGTIGGVTNPNISISGGTINVENSIASSSATSTTITATFNYKDIIEAIGDMGTLNCYI